MDQSKLFLSKWRGSRLPSAAPRMSLTKQALICGWFSSSSSGSVLPAMTKTTLSPSLCSSATEKLSSLTLACLDLLACVLVHLATCDDLASRFVELSSARFRAASSCVHDPTIGRLRACNRRRRTLVDHAARFALRPFSVVVVHIWKHMGEPY